MKTLFEQLTAKGIHAGSLTIDLAASIPYYQDIDTRWGSDDVTFKPIKIEGN